MCKFQSFQSRMGFTPGSFVLASDVARPNLASKPPASHFSIHSAIGMRYEFEDLLHDYKVDLFLAGHYHAYHRTCDGLYRSKCSNGGPTHITIGSAGAHLDDEPLYDNKWTAQNIQHEYGYGRITVMNATALRFEFVKLDDEDGDSNSTPSVRDQVWITRRR